MILSDQGQSVVVAEHGLLVAYGQFAKGVGLIKEIEQVPFKMKTVDHSPADKVAELLCHILSGGMHINELAKSPHPLGKDHAVLGDVRVAQAVYKAHHDDLALVPTESPHHALKSAL